jgi:site-specific DNA-methyltransferase (adenine-specific)
MWDEKMPLEYRNQIVTGDARELAKRIPDESIDLVFTDPPYLREYLPLYGWLAEEAARALKPGGFCMAYAGTYWKAEVIRSMSRNLDYFWDFIAFGEGPGSMVWQRRVISRHKSIFCWTKAGENPLPRCNVLSIWVGSGMDKRYHVWGQDESTARYYMDCFSAPGAVVWEPFAGGGTTPAVCKILGRDFVAFEIDPDAAQVARDRVAATQIPWFVESEQFILDGMPAGTGQTEKA